MGVAYDYTDRIKLLAPDIPFEDVRELGYSQEQIEYVGLSVPVSVVLDLNDGTSILCLHSGSMVTTTGPDENGDLDLIELIVYYKQSEILEVVNYGENENGDRLAIGFGKAALN